MVLLLLEYKKSKHFLRKEFLYYNCTHSSIDNILNYIGPTLTKFDIIWNTNCSSLILILSTKFYWKKPTWSTLLRIFSLAWMVLPLCIWLLCNFMTFIHIEKWFNQWLDYSNVSLNFASHASYLVASHLKTCICEKRGRVCRRHKNQS